MDFEENLEKLMKNYHIKRGPLYDYMKLNIGPKIFLRHPLIGLFNEEEFERMRYIITNHQLRNGLVQQQGYRLEKIVNQRISGSK